MASHMYERVSGEWWEIDKVAKVLATHSVASYPASAHQEPGYEATHSGVHSNCS